MSDMLTFEPQIADPEWGPERSVEFIVRWFYRQQLPEARADEVADRYLTAIRECGSCCVNGEHRDSGSHAKHENGEAG